MSLKSFPSTVFFSNPYYILLKENKKNSIMDKAYKSKDLGAFRSSGEEYQKPRSMRDAKIGNDVKGTMEKPNFDTHNTGIGKKIMDKMKYAPKTVSYQEFTSTKREAKLQSMVGSGVKNESPSGKMEDLKLSELPKHTKTKSFDIDVTKYSPRKAKG